jgi:hypothetical protein
MVREANVTILGPDGFPLGETSSSECDGSESKQRFSLHHEEANIFHRQMPGGRNRPLLLGVGENGNLECVVKIRSRVEGGNSALVYLKEWVAAALGKMLNIPVPQPFAVKITNEFANSQSIPLREELLKSTGLAFGSEFKAGFSSWVTSALLPSELRESAADLVAFDVMIHNPDRRKENSNVMTRHNELLVFDHDMAFSFLELIIGQKIDPWLDPCSYIQAHHIFSGQFGRNLPTLANFRQAVTLITDDDLELIRKQIPEEWARDNQNSLDQIVLTVKKRRDHVSEWLSEVEQCLGKN